MMKPADMITCGHFLSRSISLRCFFDIATYHIRFLFAIDIFIILPFFAEADVYFSAIAFRMPQDI